MRYLLRYLECSISLLAWLLPFSAYALDDPSLAVAAAQYQQLIRDSRDPAGQSVPSLLQQAEQQARKKNWTDAIARYETAIIAGADTTATWLALSQVWQAQAQQQAKSNADDEIRQRSRQRVQQSAWNALQAARAPADRTRALFRLGELYDRDKEPKQAIAAYREALELEDNPRIAKRYQELVDANAFQIKGVTVESDSATPKVCLNFSDKLAKGQQLHYEDYLVIEPTIQPVVSPAERQLCVEGVSHGQSYVIKARAGIPAASGEKTRATQEFTAKVEDRKPTLGFRGATYVLPKTGNQQLPLTSVNLEEARLRVLRINDRNLLREIENGRITRLLDGYDLKAIAKQSGEQIWEGVLTLASGERNQEVTTALPISQLLNDPQPGIYIVAVQPTKDDPESYENQATQWLVVSDLGLFTMRGNDGLHVFVRSLASAQPLAGINLRLYARNNGEFGAVTTDSQGYARLDPGLLRGNGGREPAVLMAFGNGDYNFLDLTQPAFDLSDRGVEGRAAPGAVDAFLYTERGVYRPGETVELMTLIRDNRGFALSEAPLTLKVFRPDGVENGQIKPTKPALGAYHTPIPMPLNARTGTWTAKAYTDPKGESVGEASFQVEDFVPQRMKLELSATASMLKPGEPAIVDINGRFLYGAPAANLKAEGELVLREDANPYPAFSGYRFGLVQDSWTAQRFPVALAGTDDQGKAQAQISLNEKPDTMRPLQAQVRVSLFEPGGRPVTRTLDLPYRVQPFAIGIKPRFSDGGVPMGRAAVFEVIALDPQGQPQAHAGLNAKLVREDYDYYWYYNEGRWNYKLIVRDSAAVASQTLNITAGQPAVVIQQALEWGRYRLDVLDAKTGVASSVRFTVGWFESPGDSDTPDQMKVTLDQPRYPAGATAKVFLRAPFAGEVLLNVVSDRLWLSKTVSIPADGATVELPIAAEWGPGVYLTATAFRASAKGTEGETISPTTSRGPGRAIGLAWIGLDPAPRTLNVTLNAPEEWKPRQTVDLPVTVTGLEAGQPAYLTVAAVDEGILQLTDFSPPDPVQYFLGKRRLAMQLLDLYGKLIETGGRPGSLKVGGDADSRQLEPSSIRTVKTVALFSGPVALDASGQAKIPLALPDFNGQLRLMAVAWDRNRLGRAEAAPLVRDPLVAAVYLPRFLAPEDQSQVNVTVQNLNAPAGDYAVHLSADGAVAVDEPAAFTFTIADSAIQKSESRSFTLRGLNPGAGQVRLYVQGPNGFNLVRESDIGVRPAQNLVTERTAQRLNPGETLRLSDELLNGYVLGTGRVRLSVASRPNLNVPELLAQLDRYPYGCLEQTTSRALPLIYFNEVAETWADQNTTQAGLRERVQQAIERILTMQEAGGGFGLWGPGSVAEDWLSAYAMDFLVRARQAQYLVPDNAWKRGLAYLQERLRTDNFAETELGWRAYQLYVLAREQQAAIGDLRYLHDNYLQKLPTALAQAQLGASLTRYGELERAKEAFTAALNQTKRAASVRDYGSPLRDQAALLALLAESGLLPEQVPLLAEEVAADFNQRRYTSTQEQSWLLLAAHALLQQTGELRLTVNGQATTADPFYLKPTTDVLMQGITLINRGEQPAWTMLDRSGAPTVAQPPAREGFTITRRYYTRAGQEVEPGNIRQNDLLVAVITGQAQGDDAQQALVVDLLPAGLEIENARLANNASTTEMTWLPKLTGTLHTEIRDDRFVAALDIGQGGERAFTLAYLARAVTPGVYQQPAVYVEDMYKPWQFGRGAIGTVKVK